MREDRIVSVSQGRTADPQSVRQSLATESSSRTGTHHPLIGAGNLLVRLTGRSGRAETLNPNPLHGNHPTTVPALVPAGTPLTERLSPGQMMPIAFQAVRPSMRPPVLVDLNAQLRSRSDTIQVPSPASSRSSSLPTQRTPHFSPRKRAEAEPDAVPSSASGPLSATPSVPQTFHTPFKRSLSAFRASFEPSIQLRHPAQAHGWSSISLPESGVRPIKIGIESEFYLEARNTANSRDTLEEFIDILTANHNRQLPAHSQMRRTLRPYEYSGNYYGKWCFVKESTIGTVHAPWGIELVSPILWARPGSTWRKDVEATWEYLERQYSITKSASCATHIHISFQPPGIFTLEDIRRIALAVLHFETAFEVLIPPDRRRNPYAKSNWLVGQHLGLKNKSRPESMAAINDATDVIQLIHLMQPVYDRAYAWNFNNLFDRKRTIEFRKPPGSTTADQALAWADLALSFVQAAVRYGTLEKLQKVPSTVRGLYWFLEEATVPGMNEPGRLERLFEGTAPDAALEPQGTRLDLSYREERQWEEASKRKTAADERRVRLHAQTVQDPYW